MPLIDCQSGDCRWHPVDYADWYTRRNVTSRSG
jgi:hypothetical protein